MDIPAYEMHTSSIRVNMLMSRLESAEKAPMRLLDSMLYMGINNNGIKFSDIEKIYSLFIIADRKSMQRDSLVDLQIASSGSHMPEYLFSSVEKGIKELEMLGIIRSQGGKVGITSTGLTVHKLITTPFTLEKLISKAALRVPAQHADKFADNVSKLKAIIGSEKAFIAKTELISARRKPTAE